ASATARTARRTRRPRRARGTAAVHPPGSDVYPPGADAAFPPGAGAGPVVAAEAAPAAIVSTSLFIGRLAEEYAAGGCAPPDRRGTSRRRGTPGRPLPDGRARCAGAAGGFGRPG